MPDETPGKPEAAKPAPPAAEKPTTGAKTAKATDVVPNAPTEPKGDAPPKTEVAGPVPLSDSPRGATRYLVAHALLGQFEYGAEVDDDAVGAANAPRLLSLGAIVRIGD